MKRFLFLFALSITASFAQVNIPLKPFTLQVPTVNNLSVKPISEQKYDYLDTSTGQVVSPDSVVSDTAYYAGVKISKMEFMPVYYELHRADGRTVEKGNKNIPIQMWNNIGNYVRGTITPSVVSTINYFFTLADWAELEAVMPE